jgi:hypothetical protein
LTEKNADTYVPSELEKVFDAAWVVVRPRKAIKPRQQTQLRLALARYLVHLATNGVTDAKELRRRAIEHFLLTGS